MNSAFRANRSLPFLAMFLAGLFLFALAEEPAAPNIVVAGPPNVSVNDGKIVGDALSHNPNEPITVIAEIDGVPICEPIQGHGNVPFEIDIPEDAANKEIVIRAVGMTSLPGELRVHVMP